MGCETETVEVLREAGQKLTPQRLMILSALRHADGHLTANEIYEQVRVEYPYVDISTVYRTLAVLKELRLITEADLGGDATFEWRSEGEWHHHLICRACNSVIELDRRFMESLGSTIQSEFGFEPDMDHFAIFGRCKACAADN